MSSELWDRWLLLETADTGTGGLHVSCDSDVALLAPSSAPRVLDEPVVGTFVGTIANKEDTVVEASATEMLDDTAEVELPGKGCIDSNGDWAGLESSGESSWVIHGDIREVSDNSNTTLSVASAISTSVWIVGLGLDHGSLCVGESLIHKTTIATLVALFGGAINELLLREGVELFVLEEVSTLHGSSGGESPAGATLTLVLDWGDGTLSSPVDGIWETFHMSSVSSMVSSTVVFTTMRSSMVFLVSVLLGMVLVSKKFLEFV